MIKQLFFAVVLLWAALPVYAQTGYTTLTSTHLTDSTGTVITNATIQFAPEAANGQPIAFQINGNGQAISAPVQAQVTNGAFSIQLADTNLTEPRNVCYSVTVQDNLSGNSLLGASGYTCVQPQYSAYWCTTGNCVFDYYQPNLPSLALIQTGPQGSAGPACSTGSGFCTMTVPIVLPGVPTLTNEAATKGYVDQRVSVRVLYASDVVGATPGVTVIPGSSASGTTDSAAALNAAISGGNVDLEVDSGFALSTALVISSNTTIHCIAPQYGFILQAAANTPVLINAHTNAPTTTNSTGGYVASNFGDTNIAVRGCTLNANSTQAVTGTNASGAAHAATPGGSPTSKFVGGVEFYGVNGLVFEHNNIYDPGNWGLFGSNDQYVYNDFNFYQLPQPTVHFKNTAGYQFDGPDAFLFSNGNRINAGDDAIAYNADDGQTPGTGDQNAPYIKSFVKWGDMTDIQDSNETLDHTFFGIRLLSTNDLMDRISFNSINGTACGNTGVLSAAYPNVGHGNLGTIKIDGWNVVTTGACNDYGLTFNFDISSNIKSLQISHLQLTNPGVNWPVIAQVYGYGNIGVLSLHDWDLNTTASGFAYVVTTTGGTIQQLEASGINWVDNPASTTDTFFHGNPPAQLTMSNYSGPNRLFPSGYAPGVANGDAFTNVYPVTYVKTFFNEASSGYVAGTAPATCINGCTGTWTASSGGPSTGGLTYSNGSAVLSGICTAGGTDTYCPVTINPGVSNYVMRVGVTTAPNTSLGLVMRWTNQNNFVTWITQGANQWALCDVVSGVTTCGSNQTFPTGTNDYTVTMNGTTSTLSNGNGTISGTISSSNTSGGAGINSNAATPVTLVMSAFSISNR